MSNSVHKMPTTHSDEVKNATTRSVTTTKTSPQADTTNVKITRDSVTQAVYGSNNQ